VLTTDELRDDFPQEEKGQFDKYGEDKDFIVQTIEEHRLKVMEEEQKRLQSRTSQMVNVKSAPVKRTYKPRVKKIGDRGICGHGGSTISSASEFSS